MFVSFIVTFAVFTLIVYYYQNYRQPTGFNYDNVWVVNYRPPEDIQSTDSFQLFRQTLTNMLTSMPQIQAASFVSNNVPFSLNTSNTQVAYKNTRHVGANS